VDCGAAWSFDPPSVVDNCCSNYTVVPIGTVSAGTCPQYVTQTWQVSDDCGYSSQCSQTVTVVNTNQPVFQGASDITVSSCTSTQVFYNVTATEPCCGDLPVACSPPSGSLFPPGLATFVTCTTTDCCGNAYSTQFYVHVLQDQSIQAICTDKSVACGDTNWTFDPPTVYDACCPGNYSFFPQPAITNGTGCPLTITKVWGVSDACGNSNYCTETVYVTNAPASLPSFDLPASQAWYNTEINLVTGENVTVTAIGSVYVGAPGNYQPPGGSPVGIVNLDTNLFLDPGAPWWSLIGKIGPSGAPFEVGSNTNFTAATGGNLYLSVNDYDFSDNSGTWTVWVQTTIPALSLANVQAAQRPGTQLVDIWYDLNSTVGRPSPISVQVSTNNGATFDLPANTLWGNGYGSVTPGNRRQITWDAGTDANADVSSQVVVRITSAGFSPADSATIALGPSLPGFPVVEEVTSSYSSGIKAVDFLNQVELPLTFTATVNWHGHRPGHVQFNGPLVPRTQNVLGNQALHASSTKVTQPLDMGYDFFLNAGDATGGGQPGGGLTVVAVAADGFTSSGYSAKIRVIDPPSTLPAKLLSATSGGSTPKYITTYFDLELLQSGGFTVPSDVPFFGGQKISLTIPLSAQGTIAGNGTGTASVQLPVWFANFKFGPVSFQPSVGGSVAWTWSPKGHTPTDFMGWETIGCADFAINASLSTPAINVWVVPPVFVKLGVSLSTEVQGCIDGYNTDGSPQYGGIWGPSKASLTGSVGLGWEGLNIAFNASGGLGWQVPFPSQPALTYANLIFQVSLTWQVAIWKGTIWQQSWCDCLSGSCPACPQDVNEAASAAITTFMNKPEACQWQVMPRDYLNQPYAIFNNGAGPQPLPKPQGASDALTLSTLQANVFPYSEPALAVNRTNQLLLWIWDNPARSQVNGAELVWSRWNGTAWSNPTPVWDDGTADFHPTVQLFGNGAAVAAWENEQTVLTSDAAMADFTAATEIAAASFDPATGNWTRTNLTQNSYLDRSPRLAAANNGEALLTWISNPDNSLLGSSTNQNAVNAMLWNGSSWQALGAITTNAGMLLGSTVAFNGTNGVFLAVIDGDDDQTTVDDEQLWGATFSNNVWSAFTQLTANGMQNANPQAVYDSAGQLLVAWYQGSNIVVRAGDLNLNSPTVAGTLDGSLPSMGFSLITGPAGQISMIWDDLGPDGTGPYPFLLNYDPTLEVWSQPIQLLNTPNELDSSFSGAYAANGVLLMAYDQTAILTDSNNVPRFGEVDLMFMNLKNASIPA
jgi:hypothetical protein